VIYAAAQRIDAVDVGGGVRMAGQVPVSLFHGSQLYQRLNCLCQLG